LTSGAGSVTVNPMGTRSESEARLELIRRVKTSLEVTIDDAAEVEAQQTELIDMATVIVDELGLRYVGGESTLFELSED
jgi:hypothetical protein